MATKVEVGFELTVGDTPYFRLNDPVKGKLDNTSYRLAGPIWIDISDKVSAVTIKRGKNRELDRYSSAAASVSLHNEDRTFDPLNMDSPYVGNIIPRRSVRVSTAGVTQFTGVIEDWNLDYDVSGKSNAVIQAADAFTLLAQQSLTPGTAVQQTTGERVNAVLSQPTVAWPLAQRNIDTGSSVVGADVFDGNVLSYLQRVEASEQGQLFMSKGGDVRFVNGSTSRSSGTWTLTGTNLVTNPSMESVTAGTTTLRTNLCTNPSFETNTTGWVSQQSTIARVTTQPYVGTASLQVTLDGTSGSGTFTSFTQVIGATYTQSVWVMSPTAISVRVAYTNASGITGGTATSLSANVWTRLWVTGTATTTTGFLSVITTATTPVSTLLYVDAAMIEQTDQLRDYFDGNTTDALGWDYGWSGTANASASTAKGTPVTVRTNLITNPSFETNTTGWNGNSTSAFVVSPAQAFSGTSSALLTSNGGTSFGIAGTTTGIVAGSTYTASAYVRDVNSAVQYRWVISWLDSGGATLSTVTGNSTTVSSSSWTRVLFTGAAPTGATQAVLRVYSVNAPVSGTQAYFDAVQLEVGSTASPYFDGSTGASGDVYVHAWTGTANASTSVQYAPEVASWIAPSNAKSSYAVSEKYVGTASMKCVTTASGYVPFRSNVTASTIYTASAWVKGEAGQIVIPSIVEYTSGMVYVTEGSGSNVTLTGSWQRISYTRTTAATTGIVDFRVRFIGAHTFYVDAAQLEASPTASDYFDGSTTPADNLTRYGWNGTANASTSYKEQYINENIIQFADDGTGIPYTNASVSYGTELLYNQVSVTYPGGTVTANNTESQTQYGISTTEVDTLLSNSTQAQTLADFWVSKYGQPEYRFQELTVNLTSLTGAQQSQILASELGDIISIKFTPNGVGEPIERNGQIVAISHSIGIDRHDITYGFAAMPFTFFVLDDEGYGILDNGALGF